MKERKIGTRPPAVTAGATVILVGTLALIYSVSQFLRNSVGVIAPDLASELDLSASQIGVLSSAFFFAFAGAQIPLGISLDRYGPKICMLVCAAIAVCGAALFALAASPAGLIAARVLMGLGSSCFLMAPLALYARRYGPDRFSVLVGLQLGFGSIGTLLATAPLAYAAAAIGWRTTFLGVAATIFVIGIAVALIVREDHPGRSSPGRESFRESLAGLVQALRTPSVVQLFLMQLSTYSSFLIAVGLWGGPYLTHVYGYDLAQRGQMLLIGAVAQIVGSMLWGPTERWFESYKRPVLLGGALSILSLAAIAAFGRLPVAWLVVWFIAIGASTGYVTVLIAHGRALFPPHLVGRGLTILNIGTMGGVFLSQTVSGFVIDLFPKTNGAYALDSYRVVFALQAAFLTATCIAYLWARDPRRER